MRGSAGSSGGEERWSVFASGSCRPGGGRRIQSNADRPFPVSELRYRPPIPGTHCSGRLGEAIAQADTLLLTVPNQLGVDHNSHLVEAIMKHVAPALGWRSRRCPRGGACGCGRPIARHAGLRISDYAMITWMIQMICRRATSTGWGDSWGSTLLSLVQLAQGVPCGGFLSRDFRLKRRKRQI